MGLDAPPVCGIERRLGARFNAHEFVDIAVRRRRRRVLDEQSLQILVALDDQALWIEPRALRRLRGHRGQIVVQRSADIGLARLADRIERLFALLAAERLQFLDRMRLAEIVARSAEHTSDIQSLMRISYA